MTSIKLDPNVYIDFKPGHSPGPEARADMIQSAMDVLSRAKPLLSEAARREEAEHGVRMALEDEIFVSDVYQVARRVTRPDETGGMPLIHLSVKRHDKQPIHDWRDMQKIKNSLAGPQYEGVELYPPEKRLVDTANQYHIWVFGDPEFSLGLGFPERFVDYTEVEAKPNGSAQRGGK